ncbi:hypothetical protein EUGRSUZ_H02223 [Eucalyptus grandis]|uniref:Uncharacterized protein n=2 Tax=Eucalyptus grandis TaxID=71139 RepID=A0A059B0F5_EUCGR|nr:hypothetical protein EUGRSUZ_H02223 [Eucalyptus grandis]
MITKRLSRCRFTSLLSTSRLLINHLMTTNYFGQFLWLFVDLLKWIFDFQGWWTIFGESKPNSMHLVLVTLRLNYMLLCIPNLCQFQES